MGQLCPGVSCTSGTLTLAFKELFTEYIVFAISSEMHFKESVSIMIVTNHSPNDGARTWS
jgi:hypothetical protein